MAKKIMTRYYDIDAADTLDDLYQIPQARCHELKGNKQGELALDLIHPFRLIIKPTEKPVPRKHDGGIDRNAITAVTILRVEDYHG